MNNHNSPMVIGSVFTSNGTIFNGNITTGYSGANAAPTFESFEPPEPCDKRRGGPRSKTFCEVYKRIPHTEHIGRSHSGRYFSWKENDERLS